MCGICGYMSLNLAPDKGLDDLRKMASKLEKRGPDSNGYWVSDDALVGLAHQRLSIIDLSEEGRQPMVSSRGNLVISYNGEIYNFSSIRKELERKSPGIRFRGHSDTEVILAAIETWGLRGSLQKFNGMFAFALWDKQEKKLYLVRDRIGEKPLFYGWVGSRLIFGSTINALRVSNGFQEKIDREALGLYLKNSYIPAPFSIFEGVYKLEPGHIAIARIDNGVIEIKKEPYWLLIDSYLKEPGIASISNFSGATDELDRLLRSSVSDRMISDVPIGAFLSGGIDSSLVVAIMQSLSNKRVNTFTIGFSEPEFNEAQHAKSIANFIGTDHTELYITEKDAIQAIPGMAEIYDEPFADSSQISTYIVSSLASKSVKVVLSGDGGDELFYGYKRYLFFQNYWTNINKYHPVLRHFLVRVINTVPEQFWSMIIHAVQVLDRSGTLKRFHISKLYELADMLSIKDASGVYKWMISYWKQPSDALSSDYSGDLPLDRKKYLPDKKVMAEQMMYFDSMNYLPDEILVKLDRACMAVSLEGRVPILDHRIIEYAAKLPLEYKYKNGGGKRILKNVLNKYLPKDMYDKPKRGFAVPINEWLKNGLKDWAENLLDESKLRNEGYFDANVIREKWRQHLSGERNGHNQLWIILMFQNWLLNNRL